MDSDTGELAARLQAQLTAAGTPERASRERAYLKSDLVHLGVPVPAVRALTRTMVGSGHIDTHDPLLSLADALWAQPVHEMRLASVETLKAGHRLLSSADLPACESRIREAKTWALVDPLATDVVEAIVVGDAADAAMTVTLDRWILDADFWVRRAALLSQLRIVRADTGDPTRFFGYADQQLEDPEFFIRKAIGWVLRDMSRKRPDLVFDWLAPRARRASGVTIREAIKYLNENQRAQILKAWKPSH